MFYEEDAVKVVATAWSSQRKGLAYALQMHFEAFPLSMLLSHNLQVLRHLFSSKITYRFQ